MNLLAPCLCWASVKTVLYPGLSPTQSDCAATIWNKFQYQYAMFKKPVGIAKLSFSERWRGNNVEEKCMLRLHIRLDRLTCNISIKMDFAWDYSQSNMSTIWLLFHAAVLTGLTSLEFRDVTTISHSNSLAALVSNLRCLILPPIVVSNTKVNLNFTHKSLLLKLYCSKTVAKHKNMADYLTISCKTVVGNIGDASDVFRNF